VNTCKAKSTHKPIEDQSMDEIATWKRSNAGPYLYVCGVEVASFLGTMYDERCEQLCAEINRAYAERTADSGGSEHE
jgi:hypothetical protein